MAKKQTEKRQENILVQETNVYDFQALCISLDLVAKRFDQEEYIVLLDDCHVSLIVVTVIQKVRTELYPKLPHSFNILDRLPPKSGYSLPKKVFKLAVFNIDKGKA